MAFELKDISQFLGITNACYEPYSDTIYGCQEGEFSWYHEVRHRHQWINKGKMHGSNSMIGTFMLIDLFVLSFGFILYAQALISICMIAYLLPEIDAHWYAIRMKWLK